MTGDSATFAGVFELFVAGFVNFVVTACQPVSGGDEADG
jgi:hypothetical protein